MREIVLSFAGVPTVAGFLDQGPEADTLLRQLLFQFQRIDTLFGQQTQPFTHQRRPPFWRVNAVAGNFHRRAHWAANVKIETQTVAVTLHGATERGANLDRNATIEGTAFGGVHFHHRRIDA
ncbi:hypothetical protein D3C81_906970 [compost metagenome]